MVDFIHKRIAEWEKLKIYEKANAFFAIHEAYLKSSRDMKEYYEKYKEETLEETEKPLKTLTKSAFSRVFILAERKGFEPLIPVRVYTISSRAP